MCCKTALFLFFLPILNLPHDNSSIVFRIVYTLKCTHTHTHGLESPKKISFPENSFEYMVTQKWAL